ncbi:MAG: 16S rRNA (cytosine(1402)-N(4))-methyltransferase RsmH [Chloroflexota bacterium]
MEEGHLPVMVEEVMTALSPVPGSFQIDATVGGGGHSLRILGAASPNGRLLGLDADAAAIARSRARLAPYGDQVTLVQSNFEAIGTVAREAGFGQVDGVLMDLGLSSYQLADEERGFSFRTEGRLDMRFEPAKGVPAAELIATLDADALADLFRRHGEEPHARRIARAIVEERRRAPIDTAARLAAVVERAAPAPRPGRRRIHPATRVFQALRIAVNRELEVLPTALEDALGLLRPGGRLVVIAYHSLEDRIVKRFVAAERRGCVCPPALPVCVCGRSPRLAPVGAQPQLPTDTEVAANPRARSARLRAARRLAA